MSLNLGKVLIDFNIVYFRFKALIFVKLYKIK